jgi:hypothetical protein
MPEVGLSLKYRLLRPCRLGLGICAALAGYATGVSAAPKQGDVLQTDTLSMLLVNRDYTTRTTSSLKDNINLSATIGLHYYFVDRVRIGLGLQFTERLWPEPPPPVSRFQRFALMPQLSWNFHDPFYTALSFSYAPRTLGGDNLELAVLAALGAALPITRKVKITFAVQAPFVFRPRHSLGLVALMGVSFSL